MPEIVVRRPDPNPAATSLDVVARRGAARLEAAAIKWRSIAALYGLRLDGEAVGDSRIPTIAEHAFLADAAAASGDPLFLWRVADIGVSEFGLVGYAALNAPTVEAALNVFAAMLPVVRESATLQLTVDGDVASLVGVNAIAQPLGVIGLHVVLNLLQELIGPTFVPTRTGLPVTDIIDLNAVTKAVRAPVVNDLPFSFVSFPARHLRAPVAGADERLAATLRPYWQRQAQDRVRSRAVVRSRLEAAVVRHLHEGTPDRDKLAAVLGLDQRRLKSELDGVGGSRLLVDDVRRRLARDLMRRSDLTLARISQLLGFSEPSAFTHAYRRWTGRSPHHARQNEPDRESAPIGAEQPRDAAGFLGLPFQRKSSWSG